VSERAKIKKPSCEGFFDFLNNLQRERTLKWCGRIFGEKFSG
jgi:hypothetical protein